MRVVFQNNLCTVICITIVYQIIVYLQTTSEDKCYRKRIVVSVATQVIEVIG